MVENFVSKGALLGNYAETFTNKVGMMDALNSRELRSVKTLGEAPRPFLEIRTPLNNKLRAQGVERPLTLRQLVQRTAPFPAVQAILLEGMSVEDFTTLFDSIAGSSERMKVL